MAENSKSPFLTADKLPSHVRVRELFTYQPDTGYLIRKIYVSSTARAGQRAGSVTQSTGYRRIKIDGIVHQEHRVIWFYVTGSWPLAEIDHEDGIESNNRWDNLRLADRHQQCWNAKNKSNNTSGVKGVSWYPARKKWAARIMAAGKSCLVGYFDDLTEAASALDQKRSQLHGEFARSS